MSKLPDNWIDWVTLIGAVAGLLSAIKLFLMSRWLNRVQRLFLVAAYLNNEKVVLPTHPLGGGWVFHIPNSEKDKKYYEYFNRGGGSEADSHKNLIFLKELAEKGYFAHAQEPTGIKDMKNDMYYLTAKGMRVGRTLRHIIRKPRLAPRENDGTGQPT